MKTGQLSLPLTVPNAAEVTAAIKTHVIETVLRLRRQPSARELVAELDERIGVVARWDLVSVLESLSRSNEITQAERNYLKSLLHGERMARALRGEPLPGEDATSTIDAVLAESAAYRTTRAYREMVDFVSRFRDYAPYNLMLIRIQNPSCTYFATASDWHHRFQRKVQEDARPMLILKPMGPVMAVYALDDTEGRKLPEELARFAIFEGKWYPAWLDRLIKNAARHQIRVDFKPLSSTNAGFVAISTLGKEKPRIVIHDGLSDQARFGALCHEMAHVFLGHLGNDKDQWWPSRSHLGRSAVEIEAETTAYIVTRRLGLKGTSPEYISQHLPPDGKVPAAVSFDTISKVAGKIERMALGLQPVPKSRP